jgi:hypothetical protein
MHHFLVYKQCFGSQTIPSPLARILINAVQEGETRGRYEGLDGRCQMLLWISVTLPSISDWLSTAVCEQQREAGWKHPSIDKRSTSQVSGTAVALLAVWRNVRYLRHSLYRPHGDSALASVDACREVVAGAEMWRALWHFGTLPTSLACADITDRSLNADTRMHARTGIWQRCEDCRTTEFTMASICYFLKRHRRVRHVVVRWDRSI